MKVLFLVFTFFFGACIGSFLNVVIIRLHQKKGGILSGRSECPSCKKVLGFFDLIPLVSFLFLRGKCRNCQNTISWNYFLIEALTGTLFALSSYMLWPEHFVYIESFALMVSVYWFYIAVLVAITFYDLYYTIIPDAISLPAIVIAFALTVFPFTPTISDALFGALIPFTFFALQIVISKGKWIGGGDLRLGLLMGAMLGVSQVLVALFLAYFIGSIVGIALILTKKKTAQSKIPFGPFLSAGTFIALFWGQYILDWYWQGVIL